MYIFKMKVEFISLVKLSLTRIALVFHAQIVCLHQVSRRLVALRRHSHRHLSPHNPWSVLICHVNAFVKQIAARIVELFVAVLADDHLFDSPKRSPLPHNRLIVMQMVHNYLVQIVSSQMFVVFDFASEQLRTLLALERPYPVVVALLGKSLGAMIGSSRSRHRRRIILVRFTWSDSKRTVRCAILADHDLIWSICLIFCCCI